jgi:MFS superfamily sulfate permease-like transporter
MFELISGSLFITMLVILIIKNKQKEEMISQGKVVSKTQENPQKSTEDTQKDKKEKQELKCQTFYHSGNLSGMDWQSLEEYIIEASKTQTPYHTIKLLYSSIEATSWRIRGNSAYSYGGDNVGRDIFDAMEWFKRLFEKYFQFHNKTDIVHYQNIDNKIKSESHHFERSYYDKEGFGIGALVTMRYILETIYQNYYKKQEDTLVDF